MTEARVMEVLSLMAQRLGVAVDMLWAVMVKQAVLMGVLAGFYSVIIIVGFVVVLWLAYTRTRGPDPTWSGDGAVAIWVAFLGYCAAVVGALGYNVFKTTLTGLLNPEYLVLEQALRLLGGAR
jgi:hypothetical protein